MGCMMSPRWLRPGLVSFLVLCTTFAGNLFLMQPPSKTYAPKRVEFGRAAPPASERPVAAEPSAISTASLPETPPAEPLSLAPSPSQIKALALIDAADGNSAELTRAVQRELQAKGYDTGSADGVAGLVTRAAIMAYESDHGHALTGEPSEALLKAIVMGAAEGAQATKTAPPTKQAEQVIRSVQGQLKKLGFYPGSADGRMTQATSRAIREFEAHQGLAETGRVSGQLAARLARLAADSRLAENR